VIGTVKELNLNFVPNEAKIFSLDNPVGLFVLHQEKKEKMGRGAG
jgi:hypothetical protein